MKWTIKQNKKNKKWYFSVSDVDNKENCVFPDYDEIVAQAKKEGIPAENLINARQFERYFDKVLYGNTLPIPLEIELDPSFDVLGAAVAFFNLFPERSACRVDFRVRIRNIKYLARHKSMHTLVLCKTKY